MQTHSTDKQANQLKNIDFIAWTVTRKREAWREADITKILSSRPRQRPEEHKH